MKPTPTYYVLEMKDAKNKIGIANAEMYHEKHWTAKKLSERTTLGEALFIKKQLLKK